MISKVISLLNGPKSKGCSKPKEERPEIPSPNRRVAFTPAEFTDQDREMVEHVLKCSLSMCTAENLFATINACKYVIERGIPGSFVECGVWRGGNALLAAYVFSRLDPARKVYLLDTFAGMTKPESNDKAFHMEFDSLAQYTKDQKVDHNEWCYASIEEVKKNLSDLSLLSENIVFLKGPVEDTLMDPTCALLQPDSAISVLRLDTDWYSSTIIELRKLWPKLAIGGICIVDDLGYWKGCRDAVVEYFGSDAPFWSHIDRYARLCIKA